MGKLNLFVEVFVFLNQVFNCFNSKDFQTTPALIRHELFEFHLNLPWYCNVAHDINGDGQVIAGQDKALDDNVDMQELGNGIPCTPYHGWTNKKPLKTSF